MRACLLRFLPPVTLLLGLAACSSSLLSDSSDGYADVLGRATHLSGLPLANSTVAISCANGTVRKNVPTDSLGRYGAALTVSGAAGVRVRCLFGAPDSVTARIRADASIGFSRAGQPHPIQFVDLHEVQS
jgi:hypothetical protein